ncbi:ABC transporter ATP-binding protein [Exiguobacterium undae]
MSIITFEDVQYKHILRGITGGFTEGKITTLVGPSGAGKSTCLKQMNGLISPDGGRVRYRGEDLEQLDLIELRKKIGMAFQSAPMLPGTVGDNLSLPKTIFHETLATDEAHRLLGLVDLHVDLNQPVKELSVGERSRLAIARTLVNRPDVLLLDEITSSLDFRMVKEIEQLIQRLQRELQVTVIWITHDLDQARRVSEDVWFLKDGQLLEQGNVSLLEPDGARSDIQAFLKGELS